MYIKRQVVKVIFIMEQPVIPGPPEIRGIIPQLRLFSALQNDLIGILEGYFDTYGDIYALRVGGESQIMLSRPEHLYELLVVKADDFHKGSDYKNTTRGLARFLGNGLLTSDGEFWKRQRRLVAPSLHTRRIENYAQIMVDQTTRMIDGWQGKSEIRVDPEMQRGTLSIVAQALFNADITQDSGRVAAALLVLQHMMNPFDILPSWVPTPKRWRERNAVSTLDDIMYTLIRERRAENEDKGDLLSMLILARDDDGGAMDDRQVRDEVVTLFLAGHETTANAMNWTWVLLAQNPDVERKLHEELDTVLAGRTPTLADLKQLPYTEMIAKEVLRLYPPAYSFGRRSIRATSIGEYPIPEGTEITVFSYHTHRDGRYWAEPDRFMPERFSPDNEGTTHKYAYIPFGGGPRVCIGNSFAQMETRLMLATIAQRYQLRLPPGQTTVGMDPLITLRPSGAVTMRVEARAQVKAYA